MEFRILGPLAALGDDGRELPVGGTKRRALLAMLLLHANEVVSIDRLLAGMWAEPPDRARTALQGHVLQLRRLLGRDRLVTRQPGYVLTVEPGELDLEVFEGLVGEARETADPARQAELLRRALELRRGEPLAEFAAEPFALRETARLEEIHLSALELRVDAELALGRHSELVGELEALVAAHPLRERLRGQLMLALYRSGRQADALEVYRRGRAALVDELGLDPGAALQKLERQILMRDPELDAPAAAAAASPATAPALRRRPALLVPIVAGVLAAAVAIPVFALGRGSSGGGAARATGDEVVAIDPQTNDVVAIAPVGVRPFAAVFSHGSLWVANLDDGTVSRVDPVEARTVHTIPAQPAGTVPVALAGGPNAVWYIGSNPHTATATTVGSIDPRIDDVARTIPVGRSSFGGGTVGLAAASRSLWITSGGVGPLSRIELRRSRIVETIDTRSCCPADVALGAHAVWVADTYANTVTRIDAPPLVTVINVGHGPSALAATSDAVWVTIAQDDAVVRIDPATNAVRTTVSVGRAPSGVAVGAGAVWVANSRDGTVSRIDPATNEVVDTIEVGGSPQRVAVGGGRVWVTVQRRGAERAEAGGSVELVAQHDVGSLDPGLAYTPLEQTALVRVGLAWQIEYATCAKLLNYPDGAAPIGSQLVPEVAESLPAVSPDGRTYTFTIRGGFRFSPPSGQPVTAETFKYSIERSLSPVMRGPASLAAVAAGEGARATLGDVVGAAEYAAGRAPHIAGIVARARTLTIRLLRPASDLPDRLALPFFCAVPTDTPIVARGVRTVPAAGPYYVASYTPGRELVLKRNPNYGGGRPHRLAEMRIALGVAATESVERIEAGDADYALDGIPPLLAARLRARYGRPRYVENPTLALYFLALNTSRPLFADAALRKAVNYAIDRRALVRFAAAFIPARAHADYLPPGVLGFERTVAYPLAADVSRALQLTRRRHQRAVLYSLSSSLPIALLVQHQLAKLGIDVEIETFPIAELRARLGTRGEPFDLTVDGWSADYPDPAAFLHPLLDGRTLRARGNTNIAYFDEPAYNRRLAAAERLTGRKRYAAYARLATDLARRAAPLVALAVPVRQDFFSARIGCQVYQPVYGIDLAALCLRR